MTLLEIIKVLKITTALQKWLMLVAMTWVVFTCYAWGNVLASVIGCTVLIVLMLIVSCVAQAMAAALSKRAVKSGFGMRYLQQALPDMGLERLMTLLQIDEEDDFMTDGDDTLLMAVCEVFKEYKDMGLTDAENLDEFYEQETGNTEN